MPTTVSSKRYAQAAFEIAQQKEKLEEWRSDLRRIAELARDAEFTSLVENPKLPFEPKAKLAQAALGKVNPLALNLAYLLIAKGRLKSASQIADEYDRLLDDFHGIGHARVITAVPLDDTNRERLSQRLEAIIGRKVSLSLQVDPNVLGGFVARIDDRVIDCSIRNKLEMLRRSVVKVGT